ncbi:hypothetical protein ATPR_3327 [Acetobacter tropicalis NBRC 101654]|uniref:Uncharacterized protein n=1 Tax=Acetobacter tropicalis NBRC 101654 TaxID=749388 RepID=F7VIX8_9PROT|nr:hypothetical protein ATPR_3327 [Acetobacter tropicalis NBRC 101654]
MSGLFMRLYALAIMGVRSRVRHQSRIACSGAQTVERYGLNCC